MLRLSVTYVACIAVYFYGAVRPHEPPPSPSGQIPRTEILKIVIGCDTVQGCETLYCIICIYVV
jgi:hypothetical protein